MSWDVKIGIFFQYNSSFNTNSIYILLSYILTLIAIYTRLLVLVRSTYLKKK